MIKGCSATLGSAWLELIDIVLELTRNFVIMLLVLEPVILSNLCLSIVVVRTKMVEFEYHLAKSLSNEQKHGIDFETAQQLWNDPYRIEIPAKVEDEERFLIIGKIESKYWAAVVTYRNNRVRIISVRRAKNREIVIYEGC